MDQSYMSTLASNDIPVEMKKPTKVFTNPSTKPKRKTQRKRKLTLKRRKVR